jgi:hypothetical protein
MLLLQLAAESAEQNESEAAESQTAGLGKTVVNRE